MHIQRPAEKTHLSVCNLTLIKIKSLDKCSHLYSFVIGLFDLKEIFHTGRKNTGADAEKPKTNHSDMTQESLRDHSEITQISLRNHSESQSKMSIDLKY